MSAGDTVRTALRGLGQTLITLGVVVLLFCLYELQVTNLVTARAQERLGDELERSWAAPPTTPPPARGRAPVAPAGSAPAAAPAFDLASADSGRPFARLHLPSLTGYTPRVVVEGVGVQDLQDGVGHIPGTAFPGGLGNTVLSGHRTTYGAPFADVDQLGAGDAVVLETRDTWFTYTVTGSRIVPPTAVEVTFAVPGDPVATPTKRLLTMTTCHPRYSARQRLVVSAVLSGTSARSAGRPPALEG